MNDLQRYLVDEFVEDYQERRVTRRDTLKLIASVAGSLVVAEGFLAGCAPFPETGISPGGDSIVNEIGYNHIVCHPDRLVASRSQPDGSGR